MGSTTHLFFYKYLFGGCRVAALEHSGRHTGGQKWSWGNVFLHYALLHPNPPLPSALPLAQLLPSLSWSFQRRGWVVARDSTVPIHIHTPKDKVLLASEKKNSSLALLSSLTAPSQKRRENAAVTGPLQENKLKDFSKARASVA